MNIQDYATNWAQLRNHKFTKGMDFLKHTTGFYGNDFDVHPSFLAGSQSSLSHCPTCIRGVTMTLDLLSLSIDGLVMSSLAWQFKMICVCVYVYIYIHMILLLNKCAFWTCHVCYHDIAGNLTEVFRVQERPRERFRHWWLRESKRNTAKIPVKWGRLTGQTLTTE